MDKNYILRVFVFFSLIVGSFIYLNYRIDIYGLFRTRDVLDVSIYTSERTSKFLLTKKYVPENFTSFILGPSLSNNLDPKQFPSEKLYNASVMGANVSEMRILADNILFKSKPKYVIICFDPYIVKDTGNKTMTMEDRAINGAYGSISLLKVYMMYCIREYQILPSKFAKNKFNEYGCNHFELEMPQVDVHELIRKKVDKNDFDVLQIDKVAIQELESLLIFLRENDVRVIGYFSPIPYEIYHFKESQYKKFKETIMNFMTEKDLILDFNSKDNQKFTKDYSNYIDHGHLSYRGQKSILEGILNAKTAKWGKF